MRPVWSAKVTVVAAALTVTASALAQNAAIQSAPLPPLQEQSRQGGTPVLQAPISPSWVPGSTVPGPGLPGSAPRPGVTGLNVPGPGLSGPGLSGPGVQDLGQAPAVAPPARPPATVERPNVWLPATVAKLQTLDKVNAQATELTIKVGQSATFGSLTITVKACNVRPPDQPADAAVYLDVTDSHPDSPGFDGWILRDEPSVSMMEHPIYDLRVTGCA